MSPKRMGKRKQGATPTQPSKRSRHFRVVASERNGTASGIPVKQEGKLLQLPPELQLEILSYVLVEPDRSIKLLSSSDRRWLKEVRQLKDLLDGPGWRRYYRSLPQFLQSPKEEAPAAPRTTKSALLDILLVCRTFYFVGIEAFYGENLLHFDSFAHLGRFVKQVAKDRTKCIKRLEVEVQWCSWMTYDKLFLSSGLVGEDHVKSLPKLQKVVILTSFDRPEKLRDLPAVRFVVEERVREA